MADVLASKTQVAEEALLERQHHREAIDCRREPPGATGMPRPELRRNVVEHLGYRLASRFGHAKMEAGIVNQNDEVVAPGPKIVAERVQQAEMRAELRDHLHETERGQPFDRIADSGAGLGHPGSAES